MQTSGGYWSTLSITGSRHPLKPSGHTTPTPWIYLAMTTLTRCISLTNLEAVHVSIFYELFSINIYSIYLTSLLN